MTLRWGILGCGKIASDFTLALAECEAATVTAVAARELPRAEAFAKTHGIATALGSYEALAKSSEVDAVYIATIHPSHKDQAILCLENGKHVLCEKPMALNAADTKAMVDAARKHGKFLMEGMWTRFFPAVRKARALISEGVIGEVVSFGGDFGFAAAESIRRLFDPELGGGCLLDIGIYPLAAAAMPFPGVKPRSVKASGVLAKTGVDVNGAVAISFGDKDAGTITYTIQAQTPEEFTYIGTKGYIKIASPAHAPLAMTLFTATGERGGMGSETFEFPLPVFKHPKTSCNFPNSQGFLYQAETVTKLILDGKLECDEYPLSETLMIAEVMDEVRRQVGVVYPSER